MYIDSNKGLVSMKQNLRSRLEWNTVIRAMGERENGGYEHPQRVEK